MRKKRKQNKRKREIIDYIKVLLSQGLSNILICGKLVEKGFRNGNGNIIVGSVLSNLIAQAKREMQGYFVSASGDSFENTDIVIIDGMPYKKVKTEKSMELPKKWDKKALIVEIARLKTILVTQKEIVMELNTLKYRTKRGLLWTQNRLIGFIRRNRKEIGIEMRRQNQATVEGEIL